MLPFDPNQPVDPTRPVDPDQPVDSDQLASDVGLDLSPVAAPAAPDTAEPRSGKRPVTSFVRRTSRMTEAQEKAWRAHAPRIVIDIPQVQPNGVLSPRQPLDLVQVFGREAPLVIEIGPGMGESLVALAKAHPQTNFLTFEVYRSAVGGIVVKCAQTEVDNIRVAMVDAVTGLQHLVEPGAASEFWTFFPDPWPKNRHHKRRLVDTAFASLVASRLTIDGLWRLATDWPNYADQIRGVFADHPDFLNLYGDLGGIAPRWSGRPVTRFEQRGVDEGRPIRDFTVRRIVR